MSRINFKYIPMLIIIGTFLFSVTKANSCEIENNVSININENYVCSECGGLLHIECNNEDIHVKCKECYYDEIFLNRTDNPNVYTNIINDIHTSIMPAELYYDDLDIYQTECPICNKQSIKGYLIPLLLQTDRGYSITVPTCGCQVNHVN